ncbi:hypothetical protein D9M68_751340 [compost metagenome]
MARAFTRKSSSCLLDMPPAGPSSLSSSSAVTPAPAYSSPSSGSTRPSTTSSICACPSRTRRMWARISLIVVGQAEMAMTMCFRPSSMRLAISISPSRVSSSTEPISRMYMRTGSVVRPKSESTVVSAASASSSTSSSLDATGAFSLISSVSASGAWS